MTTQPADLALLAGKLTEGQQRAIVGGTSDRASCCDVMLIEPSICSTISADGPIARLSGFTALGIQLRTHLQENSNG